jgi:hypothetical protein
MTAYNGGSYASRGGGGSASTAFSTGYAYGFPVTNLGARTLTVGIGSARDQSDSMNMVLAASVTLNLANTGANGRNVDTALAANKFYKIAIIGGAAGVASFAVNESDLSGYTLPAGYTYIRFIGFCKTDASSNIYGQTWLGNGIHRATRYQVDQTTLTVLTGGNQVVFTAVSCAAWLPPGLTRTYTLIDYTNFGLSWFVVRPGGSTLATPPITCDADGRYSFWVPLTTDASRNIEYRTLGPGEALTISITGYEMEL